MAKNGVIQWDTTAINNSDVDGIAISENCAVANLNNMGRAIMARVAERWGSSVTVASAPTVALGDNEESYVIISGTTTITSFGTPAVANKFGYFVEFSGALTLTHNGTSLILPGGASITTAAGDTAFFQHEGSGNWRCLFYQKASGAAITGFSKTDITGQSALTTPDHAADFLLLSDTSDSGNLKKVLPKYVSPVVGRAYSTEYTSNTDISTAIPLDDTAPAVGEGTQILSVSVTTLNATQRVRLRFQGLASGDASNAIIWALFRDSTNISSGMNRGGDIYAGTWQGNIGCEVEDAPAAAATYTYTVRVGPNTGTMRMNGDLTGRYFGGTSKATLVAEIIEP